MVNANISVLIPTFNRSEYINECLESIFRQTLPAAQVIVVNDGSDDRTMPVSGEFLDSVLYIETENRGKPGALNEGLRHVTGDFLWIFDDDDVAVPDALERFVDPLLRYPECGFSYGTYLYSLSEPGGKRIGRAIGESKVPAACGDVFFIELMQANFLGGAALCARTRCYDIVGGFDETLVRSQDYEMALRLALCFKGIRMEGGPAFHYRQHAGERGSRADRFPHHRQQAKWLEYDRIFFRKIYRNFPLERYLPAGTPLDEGTRRRALLQRIAIMAAKGLEEEVSRDLRHLSRLPFKRGFSIQERRIFFTFSVKNANYSEYNLFDSARNRALIGEYALRSPTVKQLNNEVRIYRLLRIGCIYSLLRHVVRMLHLMAGAFRKAHALSRRLLAIGPKNRWRHSSGASGSCARNFPGRTDPSPDA